MVENVYTWADTTDGNISLRSDPPPAPWLASTIWVDEYTYSSQDASAINNYIVMRNRDKRRHHASSESRSRAARMSTLYNGSAFRRIHAAETGHRFYAHPHSELHVNDVLQVQKGTATGEITEYRGHVGGAAFAAPDGTGNLPATVDTVQELVTAVDDLTTSGGGGGTAERTQQV